MNVLSLTSAYPRYDGDPAVPFIESIVTHVAAQGHTLHVVVPEHHEWRRPAIEDGVRFHPYRYSPRRSWTPWGYGNALEAGIKIRPSMYLIAPLACLSAVQKCRSVAGRERFDLVHAHWAVPNGPIAALAARLRRLPLVISLHGSDVSVLEQSRWIRSFTRPSLRRAAVITAPSEDLLERVRRLGIGGDLELVPYGADTRAFEVDPRSGNQLREQLGLRTDDVAVLGLGRFVHWKGFEFLIDAIARARKTVPALRLVLVGDGDLREALTARAESLGLRDHVIFTGMASRSEVPGYLSAADIVAVPSVHYQGYVDGLPNVALEAMAAGKALVATRVGGLPQVVRDRENGLLVNERDETELASAIVTLATDPALRGQLGQAGRALIRESLNWDAVGQRFVRLYERAIHAPS